MNYAIIEGGSVVNVAEADQAFAQSQGWMPLADGFGIGDAWDGTSFSKAQTPPVAVPASVAMWKARAVLSNVDGVDQIAHIDSFIETLPDPDKGVAKAKWNFATSVERDDNLTHMLIVLLGLTEQQTDALFIKADAL